MSLAESALRQVRAIHRPSRDAPGPEFTPYCEGCWEAGGGDGAPTYPCPTIQAIDSQVGAADTQPEPWEREYLAEFGHLPTDTQPEGAGEAFTVDQIHEAYEKHAGKDDWGVPAFYESGLISALRGEYDEPPTAGGKVDTAPEADQS